MFVGHHGRGVAIVSAKHHQLVEDNQIAIRQNEGIRVQFRHGTKIQPMNGQEILALIQQ